MAHKSDFDKFYYFMVVAGVVVLLVNLYYYAHPLWSALGVTHEIADSFMLKLRAGGAFDGAWKSKLLAMGLFAATLITRYGKGAKANWWLIAGVIAGGNVLYLIPFREPSLYVLATLIGASVLCWGFGMIGRNLGQFNEAVNDRRETFEQCEELIDTPDSFNLRTQYFYKGKWRDGWVNCVAPARGSIIMGVPGSGKSFSIFEPMIDQMMGKGYTMFVYDYKYPALTEVVYNDLLRHQDAYRNAPEFCVINFKDPRYSLRCNPLDPMFIEDPSDTSEVADLVMLNVNKNAVEKEDFFSMSAKLYLDAIIWFLRNYDDGKYCTFPHAIQFMSEDYKKTFRIMSTSKIPGLEFKIKSFVNAMEGNAQDQLQGQIASAQIPLGRFISPQLYWVLTGSDFTLDINNPEHPKILCVGNDPQRQTIYGTTLALITSRLFRTVNVQGKERCGVLIDEFPTVYLKGIDNLIDTARSNRVCVALGCQDKSQVIRDYGDKEAKVIFNTVGNIFSGQVNGETAEDLAKMFGREFRRRESQTRSIENDSVNISFQQEELVPRSNIETLSQGVFLGKVADTFDNQIGEKFFCGKVVIDMAEYKKQKKSRQTLPKMTDFGEETIWRQVMDNKEKEIAQYLKEKIRKDASVVYADDQLEEESLRRARKMPRKEADRLIREIADRKAAKVVDDVIKRNFERVQDDVKMIIARETGQLSQEVTPATKADENAASKEKEQATADPALEVDPFAAD